MAARRALLAGAPSEESFGYSQAIAEDGIVAISGQVGRDNATGELDGPTVPGGRAARALSNVRGLAVEASGPDAGVAYLQVHLGAGVSLTSDWDELATVHRASYGDDCPALSLVPVADLSNPDYLVEVSAMTTSLPRTSLPDHGPIGRSFGSARAVRVGDQIFLSGHLPIDELGAVVGETTAEQLQAVCDGLEATLSAMGAGIADLVANHVWVADPPVGDAWEDFATIHRRFFGADKPAATLLYVPSLPFAAKVQISAVARVRSDLQA